MPETEAARRVRAWMATRTGTRAEDWFLVSKARHGLERALAALDPGEVILQPFTCLTVANAVLDAGQRPVYADIAPETLSADPASVAQRVGEQTRAILVQHTFAPVGPVREIAAAHPGAVVIEDSAHCLGALSPAATVSLHSFGAEKRLPTRQGGAVWVNPDAPAAEPIRVALAALPEHRRRDDVAFRLTRPVRKAASLAGSRGSVLTDTAVRAGLASPAVAPSELGGGNVGEPRRLGGEPLAAVVAALRGADAAEAHRREIVAHYRAHVEPAWIPGAFRSDAVVPLRFPLLLPSPQATLDAFAALEERGLVPGRWYRPLLFPGPAAGADYGFDPADCPASVDASARILNLPTASFVTPTMSLEITDVLARFAH